MLEAALMGPMADRISVPDCTTVIQWVRNGAKAKDYPQVAPIFAKDCTGCHMANAKSIPPLTSYYNVVRVTGADTGTSFTVLAEVSHIHLFGISITFLLTGAIFAFSTTPVWFRVCLVVIPYLSILVDILARKPFKVVVRRLPTRWRVSPGRCWPRATPIGCLRLRQRRKERPRSMPNATRTLWMSPCGMRP